MEIFIILLNNRLFYESNLFDFEIIIKINLEIILKQKIK